MLIIPDASVLLKWVLPRQNEDSVEQALAIAKGFADNHIRLLLPTLWVYEVGNVLALKQPAIAEEQLLRLRQMVMPEVAPNEQTIREAIRLVADKRVSFYDAIYHAVAITSQGIFVTADDKYVRAVGEGPHVMLLAAWK